MDRPDRVEFTASVAPDGRAGRWIGRRASAAAVGWVVLLAGVAGIGVAGRSGGTAAPPAVVAAAVASPDAADVADLAPSPTPRIPAVTLGPPRPWPSPTPHRTLGDDGVMGGLTVDHPVRSLPGLP